MAMLDVGTEAPEFSLVDHAGNDVSLKALRGKWVVLYFYPRDDTPGCTREACNFRDNHAELTGAGAVVLGLSPDKQSAHAKFAQKYELPFQLLVDRDDHETARAYGAWGLKKNYGKEYEGMIRSTVVVDPAGRVAKTWGRVKPDQHGDEVLAWIRAQA
ncbi:MAG: thioredoxin-dependent thiol peroxidase [Dehalococcoidia bacterium]